MIASQYFGSHDASRAIDRSIDRSISATTLQSLILSFRSLLKTFLFSNCLSVTGRLFLDGLIFGVLT